MPNCVLKTSTGETKISIPAPGDFPSFYVFAMHKSGSSLLNSMIKQALACANVPQIAIPEVTHEAGLPQEILNPEDIVLDRGYCYRGFRTFPWYLRKRDISKNKKVLLIRDPRDMLVSFYFSITKSHIVPDSGFVRDAMLVRRAVAQISDIEDFCVSHLDMLKDEFLDYEDILGSEIRIYRYEDVIFNKVEWLSDMMSYFDIPVSAGDIERIAMENDIRPDSERPGEHIRQVTPGNFRKHLGDRTIRQLNLEFADILKRYRYQEEESQPRPAWQWGWNNLRAYLRRLRGDLAEGIAPMRSYVPFRSTTKRLVGGRSHSLLPQDGMHEGPEDKLQNFLDARTAGGGINELGLEWLIARAAGLRRIACFAEGDGAAQILTALRGAQVVKLAAEDEGRPVSKSDVIRALRDYDAVVVPAASIDLPFKVPGGETPAGCLLLVDLETGQECEGLTYIFGRLGIWLSAVERKTIKPTQ